MGKVLYIYVYMLHVHVHVDALVAQLVQHLPRTQNIAGSSPTRGSSSFSLEKKRLVFGCCCLHLYN